MKTGTNSVIKKTFWATMAFYLLIGFEFIYMASPFAAYFYSVYKPGLSFLDNYPSITWITGFFLPHIVEDTKSPILNLLRHAGIIIAFAGFLIFMVCALQVYYAKLFKKGIVKGGLYKNIRHPQYSAFALCSFGLLILWPRYLALIMFISLLFSYYLLAKAEEKECEIKYGDSYIEYKKLTGMFLPFKIPVMKAVPNYRIGYITKIVLALGLYFLTVLLSVQLADVLKNKSIRSLYSATSGKQIFISIFQKEKGELEQIVNIINSTGIIDSIGRSSNDKVFVNYILPADMYISEIPMIKPYNESNHVFKKSYASGALKIIITEVKVKNTAMVNISSIFSNQVSLKPVAEIWIDFNLKKITRCIELRNTDLRYKNIPEPVF